MLNSTSYSVLNNDTDNEITAYLIQVQIIQGGGSRIQGGEEKIFKRRKLNGFKELTESETQNIKY